MTLESFDFARLIRPLTIDAFLATYWERRHVLLKRDQPDYYQSLITAGDLERIISDSDARYPAIRLAKGGGYFAPEVYTRNVRHGDESFTGVPDVQKIADEYRRGATVALPAIHRAWKPLGLLCDAILAQFDHPAHANAYITPGNAAGFTPHYDVHEVLVLQIAGSKRWSLYAPVTPLPHRSQPFTPQAYSGQAPLEEVELNAGDLLYLPRGWLHSTRTSTSFSAHVTVGITVYTWVDLLKDFLQTAIGDQDLRKALPPGFAGDAALKPLLRSRMLEAIDRLRTASDPGALIDAFTERVRAAHVPRPAPFRVDVTVIDPGSTLQMPPPDSYTVGEEGGRALLEFNGTRYHLPLAVASTLRAMARLEAFRPGDLPDHLSPEANLGLSRQLADIGFLTLVAP